MKRLIKNSLLCFLSLTIWSTNDCVAQNLKSYGLEGKVKSVREYHYKPLEDCDYCEDIQRDSTTLEFNVSGNIIKMTEWNNSHFVEGLHKDVTTYRYNGNGKIVEKRKESHNDIVTITKYIRDAQGYIVREEEYHRYFAFKKMNEELSSIKYRKNNSNGTASETSLYHCSYTGKKLLSRSFFDENGYLTKTIHYSDNDETSEETYSREFYSTGIVAKEKEFFSDKEVKNIVRNITTWDEKGSITSDTRYIIDAKGNHKFWWKKTYSFTYDSYGNWITMKIITNDDYMDIYKRKITYYK